MKCLYLFLNLLLPVTMRPAVSEMPLSTIEYYNKNAQAFYDRTVAIPKMLDLHNIFLQYLPEKAVILGAGCGVARDEKYFLSLGHSVFAFDASVEMVKLAQQELEETVFQSTFQELMYHETFDGIWANASLLHVPYEDMRDVYKRLWRALKPGGILYASYQYGSTHRFHDNRDFYDMNEKTIVRYLEGIFEIIELRKTSDARSMDRVWLNLVARKK